MNVRTPAALLGVLVLIVPFAAAHHIYNSSTERDCSIPPGVVRACNVLIRHQVTLEPCDASGCVALHECVLELSGTLARAEGMCGDKPWSLEVVYGFVSTYVDAGTFFLPTGACQTFTVTGSGRGHVGLAPLPEWETGEFSNEHFVCA